MNPYHQKSRFLFTILAVVAIIVLSTLLTGTTASGQTISLPPLPAEKEISSESSGGPPAIIPNGSGYSVVWVDTASKSLRFTIVNWSGDTVIIPRTVYSPGNSLWKYVAIKWTGAEYGISVAVNEPSGWQTYLVRVDPQGNLISSSRLGSGGTSPYSGPALDWDGNQYGVVWNAATNNGVNFAHYAPMLDTTTIVKLGAISSSVACDVAIAWDGNRFGVMCNGSKFFALDQNGDMIVEPVQMSCTKDSIPGFAWQPGIIWDGSNFQVVSQDHWGSVSDGPYGTPRGSVAPDGSSSNCYGDAHGVSYPVHRSSITFAPNLYINTATGGKDHGIGFVWLDQNTIKLGEYIKYFDRRYGQEAIMITSTQKDVATSVETLGNIVWGENRYAVAWSNPSGIYITFALFDIRYQPPQEYCYDPVYYCWEYEFSTHPPTRSLSSAPFWHQTLGTGLDFVTKKLTIRVSNPDADAFYSAHIYGYTNPQYAYGYGVPPDEVIELYNFGSPTPRGFDGYVTLTPQVSGMSLVGPSDPSFSLNPNLYYRIAINAGDTSRSFFVFGAPYDSYPNGKAYYAYASYPCGPWFSPEETCQTGNGIEDIYFTLEPAVQNEMPTAFWAQLQSAAGLIVDTPQNNSWLITALRAQGGNVSAIQDFQCNSGYLIPVVCSGSGYGTFGPLTAKAVTKLFGDENQGVKKTFPVGWVVKVTNTLKSDSTPYIATDNNGNRYRWYQIQDQ
ncbi:MAG: hypothetical protein G01um101433_962, partial [Parcubacteria group bacterium Gr01-1014_33]